MTAKTDDRMPNHSALVQHLIQAAAAEERLLLDLGEAVGRGDQAEVFRIAEQLTGRTATAERPN